MINIFIGALVFSILCVTLFLGKSIGLSMLLFIVPLTYYIIHILEKNKKIENSKAKILIIPITLLASTYFLFNNAFFNDINRLAIPILIVLMIIRLFNEKIKLNFDFIGKILGMFLIPISFIGETFEKLITCLESKLKINIDSRREEKIKKVVKSIFITLPIVLVIIILLSSADVIFGDIFVNMLEKTISAISQIKISTILIKIILIICAFIYMLCFFDYISSRYEKDEETETNTKVIKDNFTIKMILTTLNIVYLLFCYIQIKSLFMRNVDIDYAQYARQGFFQLMIVSLINLITILIAKKCKNQDKYINTMSVIMIGFTYIILISSAVRMYFYESAYGYTILRLLVYVALFTESILLIPTIFYAIDKPVNIAKSYFTIILSAYIITNIANINSIIAQRNVNRYFETGKIDVEYLKKDIGIDAIPAMSQILETESAVVKTEVHLDVRQYIYNEVSKLENEDFNLSEFNISKMIVKNIKQYCSYFEDNIITNTSKQYTQEEKILSMQNGGNFVKLGNVAVYVNDFDEYVYIFNTDDKTHKKLYHSEDGINTVYFDGQYVYLLPSYYRGKGIIKIDLLGNAYKIYEGGCLQLWIKDDKIYFTDQIGYDQINGTPQGNLCVMNKDGSNKKVIIENVKNNFKIVDNYIYYTDKSSRSIFRVDIDGNNKKQIAIGKTYITSVTDKYLTYLDYSNGEKHRIVYFDNPQNTQVGKFGSLYNLNEDLYFYTKKIIDSNNVENNFSLYKVDINNHSLTTCWKDEENSFDYLGYIYNTYGYFRRGSEYYKVNLNNRYEKQKMDFGSETCFIDGKAYSVKTKDGEITGMSIYDLNK